MSPLLKKKSTTYAPAWLIALSGGILLLITIVLAVCVGKYQVSPAESLHIIFSSLINQASGHPQMTENVVLGLRIPRILISVLAGAALAASGAAYQGIFKNPLVSPDFLGVSSGACIGAAIAILLSLTAAHISLFAFIGGIIAVIITMAIPSLLGNKANIMLVLSGIIVGTAMSSILGFIKYIADPDSQLASITYWTMGSFGYVGQADILPLFLIISIPLTLIILMAWWIDVLAMGEDEAKTLGAAVILIRTIVILCATLLTASTVSVAGTISWVGLIVPHFGRMLVGPANRKLIPVSAILGGLFMLLVDTLTRTLTIEEMPVSILTGVIGAPVFCYLLFRQRGQIR